MIPKTWIFLAVCFAPDVVCSQNTTAALQSACDVALREFDQIGKDLQPVINNLTAFFGGIWDHYGGRYTIPPATTDNVTEQRTVEDICRRIHLLPQAAEKFISRCNSDLLEECPVWSPSYSPDVLRAAARFCVTVQADEYKRHFQTLSACKISMDRKRSETARQTGIREDEEIEPIIRHLHDENVVVPDNTSAPCELTHGRKYVCRKIQIIVPLHTDRPNSNIREVCGQKEHDLVRELQKRALDALNCSEFGDYVKEWGWLKVKYQASRTTATHHR